jgi:hypothetical protein
MLTPTVTEIAHDGPTPHAPLVSSPHASLGFSPVASGSVAPSMNGPDAPGSAATFAVRFQAVAGVKTCFV